MIFCHLLQFKNFPRFGLSMRFFWNCNFNTRFYGAIITGVRPNTPKSTYFYNLTYSIYYSRIHILVQTTFQMSFNVKDPPLVHNFDRAIGHVWALLSKCSQGSTRAWAHVSAIMYLFPNPNQPGRSIYHHFTPNWVKQGVMAAEGDHLSVNCLVSFFSHNAAKKILKTKTCIAAQHKTQYEKILLYLNSLPTTRCQSISNWYKIFSLATWNKDMLPTKYPIYSTTHI